jgi:F-type H+-transporting ATPase subunit a
MQPWLFLAEINPLEHVVQHTMVRKQVGGVTLTLLSNHILIQILAALILLVVLIPMFRWARIGRAEQPTNLVPRGFRNFVEAVCEFFRSNLAKPQLGDQTDRLMPFIWTVFAFILTCNLLGLVPLESVTKAAFKPLGLERYAFGGTPTGNLWINGTLASFALVAILYNGFRQQGLGYLKHFIPGPIWMAPLMVIVELAGLFAKIVALAIRLFANMLAGHMLLAVLLGLISLAFVGVGLMGGLLIALPLVAGSVAINLLELFVAFLQAFIFTFLIIVFVGQAIHHEEHEGEHAGESHAVEVHPPA